MTRRAPNSRAYRSASATSSRCVRKMRVQAAELGKLAHQVRQELGRIDEPVSRGLPDEIAVAAVRLGRVEPAVVDVPRPAAAGNRPEPPWPGSSPACRSSRSDRPERLQRRPLGLGRLRLGVNVREFARLAEHVRGQLAARIAVDAGRIDKKRAQARFRAGLWQDWPFECSGSLSCRNHTQRWSCRHAGRKMRL